MTRAARVPAALVMAAATLLLGIGIAVPAPAVAGANVHHAPAVASSPARVPVDTPVDTPVVLAGVSGLQWSDVDATRTPNLWRLVGRGSVASVSVRTLTPTCPLDAWLSLSAGSRVSAGAGEVSPAAEPGNDDTATAGCHDVPVPAAEPGVAPAVVPGWDELTPDEATASTSPTPGALGDLVALADTCSTAVGPGAAVALARTDGTVDRYVAEAAELTEEDLSACPVTVVDLGVLPDAASERAAAMEQLDDTVGRLAGLVTTGGRLVVAGIADTPLGPSDLQVVVDWTAPGARATWLTSTSARWPGVVVLGDLAATLAAAVGADDQDDGGTPFTGSPLERGEERRLGVARTVENRRYLGVLTETVPHMSPVLIGTLGAASIVVVGGLLVARRHRHREAAARGGGAAGNAGPPRAGHRLALATLVLASCLPVASSLATLSRWWVWTTPVATLTLWLVLAALGVALIAWGARRLLPPSPWRLATTLAGATWLVLTVDGLTGTTLQQGSLLGPAPSLGARFFGFSNAVFAVYGATGLILAAGLGALLRARGRARAAWVTAAVVAVVTVLVDGLPPFGADLGGILALVPGFGILLLSVARARVTVRRLLAVLGITVGVVLVVAVADWVAPGPGTHLGGFVQSVLDGRAAVVVAAKAAGAWATVANPGGALALVGCAIVIWAVLDPGRSRLDAVAAAYRREPLLRSLAVALATTAAIGTFVNDSGIAVAAFFLLVATPILVAGHLAADLDADAETDAVSAGSAPARGRVPSALAGVAAGVLVTLLLGGTALPARGLASAGDVADAGQPLLDGSGPVVVVGTQGLRWDDVTPTATPALWAMLRDGASATGVTAAVTGASGACPSAGWLGLSSGRSVVTGETFDDAYRCAPWSVEPSGGGEAATVNGWEDLVALQARSEFRPRLGALPEALGDAGVCATAVGPGAGLLLADGGTVSRFRELDAALADPAGTFGCPLTVVDAGAAPFHPAPEDYEGSAPMPEGVTAEGNARIDAVRQVDDVVRRVLAVVPADATVLVLDVGNPSPARPSLGVGVATADADGAPTYLTTSSTHWLGVVRLLDLPVSLVTAFGAPHPADLNGSPLAQALERPADAGTTAADLAAVSIRDHALRVTTGTVTMFPVYASLVALALVVLLLPRVRRRTSTGPARTWSRALDVLLLVCASVPAASFLMTTWAWWRLPWTGLGLWAALAASTALVALVGSLAPRNPAWAGPTVVATLTFALLTLDGVLGTPLHRGSPIGSAPTLGGRYYGFGNPTYSVYAVAAVVCAAGLATAVSRRWGRVAGALVAGAVGAVALVVDVWPTFGADVGGGLVLVPVFAVLVLAVLGARVTWRRLLLTGGAGVLLVGVIGVLDWLRPPAQRSHLGTFVQSVLDGTAAETVLRKGGYALRSLAGGAPAWLTLAVLVALVLVLWGGARFRAAWLERAEAHWPLLRPVLVSLILAGVGGALINDYGVRVVTLMLFAAVPLLGLVVLRTDELVAAEDLAAQDEALPRKAPVVRA